MSTILLADDDQLLRLIMRERLERAGHEVFECGDGFAALEIAMQERPDCLVLDVMMPLARGLEVVRQVRRQDDWHPGIVMVSARTRVTDRLNALEAGADVYLEKPVAPNALAEAVIKVTEDRAPTRIVDILGPVWATLAMDRLLLGATDGDAAKRAQAITRRFADSMQTALGRGVPNLPPAPIALRVLWEQSLRSLIGDATDPTVPATSDVRVPDIHIVLRDFSRSGLEQPTVDQTRMWANVLSRALLRDEASLARGAHAVRARFASAFGHVLGIGTSGDMWATNLAAMLGRTHAHGQIAASHLLEKMVGTTLGDVLGIHAIESEQWTQTLATVLAHQHRAAAHVELYLEGRVTGALGVALGRGDSRERHAPFLSQELWNAAMDEILRTPTGVVSVPDVRGLLSAPPHREPTGSR